MAKPFAFDPPATSNQSLFPRISTPQRRRRSKRSSRHSISTPSVTLLSLLASLASTSTVYGSPAPPSFLCPILESSGIADSDSAKTPTRISKQQQPRALDDTRTKHSPRNVPNRYSQEADGVWRRVGTYTLYGSTMPACTSTCATPTAVISPLDDQLQVSDKSDAATAVQYETITDLPPGWRPPNNHGRTALILLVSLFLALFIGSFIVGCMFWRNRVKSGRKSRDVEAKAKKKRRMNNEEDVREALVEKEIKAKQKIWARATARWKSHARYSARQRRGNRLSSRLSQANNSNTSLNNSRTSLTEQSPTTPSNPTPPSSISENNSPPQENILSSSSSQHDISNAAPISPEPPAPTSPPAYHHHGRTMSTSRESAPVDSQTSTGKRHTRQPSSSSLYPALSNAPQPQDSVALHVAHVATDDKALLARLADLASAPPEDTSLPNLQTSAPEWHDEDLEDIAPHLLTEATTPFPFSPMFPPPPSKERLAAAEFYDHSYAFEDVASPELESGPSAPPFEEGSSLHLQELAPSAPPLFDDDQFPSGVPSAPLDPSSDQNFESEQEDTSSEGLGHEVPDDFPSSTTTRGPFSAITPVRDSVILPGYHP